MNRSNGWSNSSWILDEIGSVYRTPVSSEILVEAEGTVYMPEVS